MNRRYLVAGIVVTVLIGGSVWAQRGETPSDEPPRKEAEQIAKDRRSLIDEDIDSLSGQQMLGRAENKIKEAKDHLEMTERMLKEARQEEQDIVKINCINDKQAALKGFLKVAEQSYVKLKRANSQNDGEEAKHHYTLVSISHQRAGKLAEEARLCAGEVQRYAEGTKVEVNVDDDITEPGEYLPREPIELVELPELTPYQ